MILSSKTGTPSLRYFQAELSVLLHFLWICFFQNSSRIIVLVVSWIESLTTCINNNIFVIFLTTSLPNLSVDWGNFLTKSFAIKL